MFRACNAADYRLVHAQQVQKVWRLNDGLPLRGPSYTYRPGEATGGSGHHTTGTALDGFLDALVDAMDIAGDVVGRPGDEWQEATLAPWIYPQDSGLSLHQDVGRGPAGQHFTGSYTYYVNQTWNLHWGGWLMLLDPADAAPPAADGFGVSPPWLSDDLERAWVDGPGIATAVLPAPNRIVFISPAVRHLITRVDRNAGQHARVSLAGFFVHKG